MLLRETPIFATLEQGFRVEQTVRHFESSVPESRRRADEAFPRIGSRMPASWRTVPLRGFDPAEILPLVAGHALMESDEFRRRCAGPGAFDPDLSVVLLDGTKVIGCMLTIAGGDTISVPVRVVALPAGHLRALGNLALLHGASRHAPANLPFRRLVFRGGEIEHRETANLMPRQVLCRAQTHANKDLITSEVFKTGLTKRLDGSELSAEAGVRS